MSSKIVTAGEVVKTFYAYIYIQGCNYSNLNSLDIHSRHSSIYICPLMQFKVIIFFKKNFFYFFLNFLKNIPSRFVYICKVWKHGTKNGNKGLGAGLVQLPTGSARAVPLELSSFPQPQLDMSWLFLSSATPFEAERIRNSFNVHCAIDAIMESCVGFREFGERFIFLLCEK